MREAPQPAESDDELQLQDYYAAGERDFSDRDLCGIEVNTDCLSYARFRRSKLKQVNLQDMDLRGVDLSEANLSRSNLNHADLRGAALNNGIFFLTSFNGANLQGADLSGASLDITDLEQANLQGANLCGAYLRGLDLSQVNLQGAYFDPKTQFDRTFDPLAAGMQQDVQTTMDDLVLHFNQLSQCATRYLGDMIVAKYWAQTQVNNRYLAALEITAANQFSYAGPAQDPANLHQLKWAQLWINRFLGSCSLIVQDLPNIAEQKNLLVVSAG
ncbi:pentapeptide repeat-containing protein [Romeriopsis navalis]|uniref:pentapeptide repeat-containing protein n=1 Tax=Romeriopsis navalis TaxID=2992132 RepID=UPI0021F87B77|nr:pentapeptide repeat-containing protein [Romeriopsis navalis]